MVVIIIIDEYYFDVTEYVAHHPGGGRILQKYHMRDATVPFNEVPGHSDAYALGLLDAMCLGRVCDIKDPLVLLDTPQK